MKNSIKYAKLLEDTGLPRNQAEMHIKIISNAFEEEMTTKQDILRLDFKLQQTENNLKAEMKQIENRVTIKLGVLITFLMLTLPAVSKNFFG